jgi:S-adenosylmethionine decarboxylase
MDFIGYHVFGSFSSVKNIDFLDDIEGIRKALNRGVERAHATALSWQVHAFEPQGCTIIGLLSESHVSVHTYPEHRALFFDAFTCGEACKPSLIFAELHDAIGSCQFVFENFKRSVLQSERISRGSSHGRAYRHPLLQWTPAYHPGEVGAP